MSTLCWEPSVLRTRIVRGDEVRSRLLLLREALEEAAEGTALVGGALRDAVLGRNPSDLDWTLPPEALPRLERWISRVGGTPIPLHEPIPTVRVAFPGGECWDFTAWRRSSLEEDLQARDFTVNALAVPLWSLLGERPWQWVDPCGGRLDLESKRLAWASPESPREDPLRLLRAFRLVGQLGLFPTEAVRRETAQLAPRILEVAPERIREEFFRLLEGRWSYRALRGAEGCGLIAVLFPELAATQGVPQNEYHHLDVWAHTLCALDRFEREPIPPALEPYRAQILTYLEARSSHGVSHRALIKFAILFHDVAKLATRSVEPDGRVRFLGHEKLGAETVETVAGRLRLGKKATEAVVTLVREHLRTMQLDEGASLRALNRFLRDTGDHWLGELLLIWADLQASRGPARTPEQIARTARTLRRIADYYFHAVLPVRERPRLLTGHDLMERFGVPEGPQIGRILRALEEAQIAGEVRSRQEALRWVADRLDQLRSEAPSPPDTES